jgi:hypothetical protein
VSLGELDSVQQTAGVAVPVVVEWFGQPVGQRGVFANGSGRNFTQHPERMNVAVPWTFQPDQLTHW